MMAQENECHVVNTSSGGALIYGPGGLYSVSKHAVVGLSETLCRELAAKKSRIHVSIFCPGFVKTRIQDSVRNYPFTKVKNRTDEQYQEKYQARNRDVDQGLQPEEAVEILFHGIEENKLYILTDPEMKPLIQYRMECILKGESPQPGARKRVL